VTSPDPAYVALALTPGIGRARLDVLLATFGTAASVLEASQRDLARLPGMSRAAATAIREANVACGESAVARTESLGGCVLTPAHSAFPAALRSIPDAPTLLFAAGRLHLLDAQAVAIVGSRTHTRYGAEVCRMFARGLSRAGLAVVSGMARGLDRVAHEAAMDEAGGTVGVLGNGFGVVYPTANRLLYDRVWEKGCVLTEHAPGERPHAGSFPRRNRLVSGLARVTLVVEARERSGALITADCALAQSREVLAVPGPIFSPLSAGCNRLIQHGAKPALGIADVLEEYDIAVSDRGDPAPPSDLTDDERVLLDILGLGIEGIDEIAAHARRTPADVLAVLTGLEIRGLALQEPGKIFRLAHTTPVA